jgi:hypothetical protein
VHDIFEMGSTMQERYSLPIELLYQQEGGGGFIFTLHRSHTEDDGWEWPGEWIDRVAKKKKWMFSTLELVCRMDGLRAWKSTIDGHLLEKAKRKDEGDAGGDARYQLNVRSPALILATAQPWYYQSYSRAAEQRLG